MTVMDESIYKIAAGISLIIVWYAAQRLLSRVDTRFDKMDEKLDKIINVQIKQDKKILRHDLALAQILGKKYLVTYDDPEDE